MGQKFDYADYKCDKSSVYIECKVNLHTAILPIFIDQAGLVIHVWLIRICRMAMWIALIKNTDNQEYTR